MTVLIQPPDAACDLQSVIATDHLNTRASRPGDTTKETQVLLRLQREVSVDPTGFFQQLVDAALTLSNADSTGISLLNERAKRFIWPAVAGPFQAYLWEGTPSDFGPCGTVLERNATQLMRHPERHFTYLQPIRPGLAEVLLVPFHIDGKAVGTIWAVIHEHGRHFDGEDKRLLESLSTFASSAYRTLAQNGLLEMMLQKPARHQCLIYSGAPSSHLPDIARTLIQRLKANHRCLYLNSPAMVAGMRSHLAAAGIDPRAQMERGALNLSSDQGHLIGGKFDVDRMIRLLRDSVQQALADGYVGLWAAGDMTWEFGSETNLDKLLEYERSLEEFMQGTPALSGICLYHRDTLPAHAIETALITHPTLFISATLSQLNSRYSAQATNAATLSQVS